MEGSQATELQLIPAANCQLPEARGCDGSRAVSSTVWANWKMHQAIVWQENPLGC